MAEKEEEEKDGTGEGEYKETLLIPKGKQRSKRERKTTLHGHKTQRSTPCKRGLFLNVEGAVTNRQNHGPVKCLLGQKLRR